MAKAKLVTGDVGLSSGKVLTEADFERMADEAEFGEIDIDAITARGVRPGGRPRLGNGPSTVLQVRLDPETRAQLDERAEHDHRTASAIAREAIQRYLNAS